MNAATVRHLVPYLKEATEARLNAAHPLEQAVIVACREMAKCYDALSHESIFAPWVLKESSRLFALQYVALAEAHDGSRDWRTKPKLHLFLELCAEGSRPATCWTYRDEDYGSTVARVTRRRGGHGSVLSTSQTVLECFRIKNPIARIF